jgi:hypothetical protein
VRLRPAAPSSEKSQAEGLIHYAGAAGVGLDSPSLPIGHPKSGVFGYDRQTRVEDKRIDGQLDARPLWAKCL